MKAVSNEYAGLSYSTIQIPSNRGFPSLDLNSIDKMHRPAFLFAVDGQRDLCITRRVIHRIPQNQELGAELRHRQDVTVDVEVDLNVR